MKTPLLLAATLSAALPMGGCFVTTDELPPSRTVVVDGTQPDNQEATLVVTWTITGVADSNECVKAQVANIEISIVDSGGTEIGAYQQECSEFSTSIRLRPGTYSAYAVLLDQGGRTRTTDASIAPLTLRANESLTVRVDFPSNSFR